MDLHTAKFGLSIAVCTIVGIVIFFALYIRMGEKVQKRAQNKD